jgi:amino acid permease
VALYSLRMIVYCIDASKKYNYDEVLQHAFGKIFGILMRVLFLFFFHV